MPVDPYKVIECYKKTTDNWVPNYQVDLVKIMLILNIPHVPTPYSKVVITGDDDLSMEFEGTNEECYNKFLQVIALEDVTFDEVEKIGLTQG